MPLGPVPIAFKLGTLSGTQSRPMNEWEWPGSFPGRTLHAIGDPEGCTPHEGSVFGVPVVTVFPCLGLMHISKAFP